MNKYQIPTDKEKERFLSHININENKRILFSSPFGSGKTTFLHEFFKEHEEYTPIFLRPINYSIASNKDIFEYIKVDILFELLKIAMADNVLYSNKELMPAFIADEIYPFICRFIKAIPYIGKPLEEISKALKVSIKKYEEFKESKNETEYSTLTEFLKIQLNEEGNIFEENNITCAIRNIIERYKGESRKQMVLIIDDLDRIDPEHIFRILNVFACNADSSLYGEELNNKFGFDKVMVVCDINNLRYLFAHKYGSLTDFCGYIDKFYDTNIYNFSLKNDIITYLPQFITNLNTPYQDKRVHSCILISFLTDLILADLINLRSLHNLNAITLNKHGYRNKKGISIQPNDAVYTIYQFMNAVYLTEDKVNDIFLTLKSHLFDKRLNDNYNDIMAYNICASIFDLQTDENRERNFTVTVEEKVYECGRNTNGIPTLDIINGVKKENITDYNPYPLIEEAFKRCKQIVENGGIAY